MQWFHTAGDTTIFYCIMSIKYWYGTALFAGGGRTEDWDRTGIHMNLGQSHHKTDSWTALWVRFSPFYTCHVKCFILNVTFIVILLNVLFFNLKGPECFFFLTEVLNSRPNNCCNLLQLNLTKRSNAGVETVWAEFKCSCRPVFLYTSLLLHHCGCLQGNTVFDWSYFTIISLWKEASPAVMGWDFLWTGLFPAAVVDCRRQNFGDSIAQQKTNELVNVASLGQPRKSFHILLFSNHLDVNIFRPLNNKKHFFNHFLKLWLSCVVKRKRTPVWICNFENQGSRLNRVPSPRTWCPAKVYLIKAWESWQLYKCTYIQYVRDKNWVYLTDIH